MAQRIQLKRSSIPGKRPDGSYLQAGELALNTNATDPGVFFEVNTGAIAKVGPTAVSVDAPATEVGYGPGETWLDTGNNTFNVYSTAASKWLAAQSPTFSGSPKLIFVGTNFPEASDDLSNDGSARPFSTLNRAVIEVARRSILQNRVDDPFNDKFTIMLLPGDNTVLNDPGIAADTFIDEVAEFTANQALPLSTLRLFNPIEGGVILPRGTSIVGFDLRKTNIRPTFKPFWSLASSLSGGVDVEARTSTVKWTGNSYVSTVTFKDKKEENSVTAIDGLTGEIAVCTSLEPHGFRSLIVTDGVVTQGDLVKLTYPSNVARAYQTATEVKQTVAEGSYYVSPLTPTTFTILKSDGSALLREELPGEPGASTVPAEFVRLTYTNTTHHRLSSLGYATETELNDFYVKVQDAFKTLDFGGQVNDAEVATGESTIVAAVPSVPTITTDDTKNASPYVYNVSVRSDWGMCGVLADGSKVNGFKSALSSNLTVVSIQNDSDVYELYSNSQWVSAKQAYATAYSVQPSSVTNAQAMGYITASADLQNIRFYFATSLIPSEDLSNGLADEKSDTRHYAIKADNSALVQATANYSIGAAIAFWSAGGSSMTLASCTSNFGIQALRSEGFAGINTAGGAIAPDQGFTVLGVRRPMNVTKAQLIDVRNHERIYLDQNVLATTATTITFANPIDTEALLPYTLRPGTAIWVENIVDGTTASAILTATPLSADKRTINVESSNNGINAVTLSSIGLLYLRRFVDPRNAEDQSCALWVNNSGAGHRAPQAGDILRFAETPNPASTGLIAPGSQLDPGLTGGWNHVFGVEQSLSAREGNNPNRDPRNPVIAPSGSEGYYVELALKDSYGPWIGNQTTSPANYRYPRGAVVTSSNRNFRADANQLGSGIAQLFPNNVNSVWSAGENFEVQSLVGDTYVSASAYEEAAKDPFDNFYTETSQYVRGVGINGADYKVRNFIDYDNATTTLGLEGSGVYANFADPLYINPPYNNSSMAVTRFLKLLGYSVTDITAVLQPQRWSERNILVNNLGMTLSGEGYALAAGAWPVEFNVQSTILSVAMNWEWCGYLNYTKGLPLYQGSSLPLRQRFDAIVSEAWGGQVSANGITETGETVLISSGTVDESGRAVAG